MGTTNFNGTTAYTDPSSYTNTYTLPERTGKARMITAQEAESVGCVKYSERSCPNWMYNYLYGSASFGGTVNDNPYGTNYGYWTMSSRGSSSVHYIRFTGELAAVTLSTLTGSTGIGARAVVVISK